MSSPPRHPFATTRFAVLCLTSALAFIGLVELVVPPQAGGLTRGGQAGSCSAQGPGRHLVPACRTAQVAAAAQN